MLFDRVFLYLNTATTIAAVMSPLGRNSSGKRARSPKIKRIRLLAIISLTYSKYQVIKTEADASQRRKKSQMLRQKSIMIPEIRARHKLFNLFLDSLPPEKLLKTNCEDFCIFSKDNLLAELI